MKHTTLKQEYVETFKEELANSITHGIGAVLSVFGFGVLLTLAILQRDVWSIISVSIYGVALTLLYTTSTLYHALQRPNVKRTLQILDHCAIFVLIAGTYTPFLLVSLRTTLGGMILFGIIWILALTGIILKLFFTGKFVLLSTAMYVLMGWLAVFAAQPMIERVPMPGLWWLLAGGIAYTLGTVFYLAKRLPFHHSIWHVFVLGGSVCHFIAICFYVVL